MSVRVDKEQFRRGLELAGLSAEQIAAALAQLDASVVAAPARSNVRSAIAWLEEYFANEGELHKARKLTVAAHAIDMLLPAWKDNSEIRELVAVYEDDPVSLLKIVSKCVDWNQRESKTNPLRDMVRVLHDQVPLNDAVEEEEEADIFSDIPPVTAVVTEKQDLPIFAAPEEEAKVAQVA